VSLIKGCCSIKISLRAPTTIDTNITFNQYVKKYSYENIGKGIIRLEETNKTLKKLKNQLNEFNLGNQSNVELIIIFYSLLNTKKKILNFQLVY